MSDSITDTFTQAVKQGSLLTVLVNARRRIPASGIIYQSDLIVTANHVVERDDDLTVVLPDGKSINARLAGRDPGRDIALLRLAQVGASPAQVAGSPAQVGQPVFALARPGSQGIEASFGIVSAISDSPVHTGRGGVLEKYLRAEINPYPGFSGGSLVNFEGRLLGMNTSGFGMGSLITIPADVLWNAAQYLAEHGSVHLGYLGIRSQPVSLTEANQSVLSRSQDSGLLLVGIERESPAASAGLIVGDILVGIAGQPLTSHEALQSRLTSEMVGKAVSLEVLRGGQRIDVTVTIGERK
jgi:S1-C subfamily serine protease